jgi:hypothetical protein
MIADNQPLTAEMLARIIDPAAWIVCDDKGMGPYNPDVEWLPSEDRPSGIANVMDNLPWYIAARLQTYARAEKMLADYVAANLPAQTQMAA